MNKKIIGVVVILVLIGTLLAVGGFAQKKIQPQEKVDVVFVGPSQGTESFTKSTANAKLHYDKVIEAGNLAKKGEYEKAVALLKESLPYASFKFEAAAVHYELAEIYKKTGDLKNEMESLKESAKYTGNPVDKEQSLTRVQEIQKSLDSQK